jgi:AhpD family alkylhydroperoxidase
MNPQRSTQAGANIGTMTPPRIQNPASILADAGPGIQALIRAAHQGGVPRKTLELVHLRVSQINGCSACVDSSSRAALKSGETQERLLAVSAWRHGPYFTEAERAALALAEDVTRLADRPDAVPDEVWSGAARHYDEKGLAALVLWIAVSNLFNRFNVSTRQPVGAW